jgi:transcription antitermination factor NusG
VVLNKILKHYSFLQMEGNYLVWHVVRVTEIVITHRINVWTS